MICRGAKIAGILMEGEGKPVTVAIAWRQLRPHPPEASIPRRILPSRERTIAVFALLQALKPRHAARLDQWDRGAGFAAIRTGLAGGPAGIGAEIRRTAGERETTGHFEANRRGRPADPAARRRPARDHYRRKGLSRPRGVADLTAAGPGCTIAAMISPKEEPRLCAARRCRRDRHEPVALRPRLGGKKRHGSPSISASPFAATTCPASDLIMPDIRFLVEESAQPVGLFFSCSPRP